MLRQARRGTPLGVFGVPLRAARAARVVFCATKTQVLFSYSSATVLHPAKPIAVLALQVVTLKPNTVAEGV